MATDYLLALLSLAWGGLLWRRGAEVGSTAILWWAGGFFAAAAAAGAGGTVHGFRPWLSAGGEAGLWRAALYAIGLFAFCAMATAVTAGAPPRLRTPLLAVATLLLAAYLAWTWGHDEFRYAVYAYGFAMVVLLAQQGFAWLERRAPSAPWIVAGIAATAVGSAVQQAGLALHERFNHNDLFHVIQIGGGYLFYRGGRFLSSIRLS